MKPLFQGACTALVTPFRLDFVHTEAYDQLLDRQMKAGIAALVVCGTTGESATMSDTERLDLIGHTVDYVRGRCKVIAGTGSNHTAHAVTLSKEAEKLGADGLLLVSPYYNKATEAGSSPTTPPLPIRSISPASPITSRPAPGWTFPSPYTGPWPPIPTFAA